MRFGSKLIYSLGVALCLVLLSSFAIAHEGLPEQIAAMTRRIKRDPKNASLYLQRGELYRLNRNWSRAAADYNRAAVLQPDLKVVDLARGRMFFESGRLRLAKTTLDRFLSNEPNHYEGLVIRARVLARLGLRAESARDFTQILASAPDPELYLERAKVIAADHRQIDEALSGLDEGIKRLGPLVTLQVAAIDLELRRHAYDAALARLDTVTAQSERKETWLFRRGKILKLAGRDDEARAGFTAALAAIESLPPERRYSRTVTALQRELQRVQSHKKAHKSQK